MGSQTITVTQTYPVLEIITIIISIIALIISTYIGYRQTKISKLQIEMNNKVELYLDVELFRLNQQFLNPAICVHNVGGNVIYLEKQIIDGREYSLANQIIPPVTYISRCHTIWLSNNITYNSFEIYFRDWKGIPWKTKGCANLHDGVWNISYSPCEKRKE